MAAPTNAANLSGPSTSNRQVVQASHRKLPTKLGHASQSANNFEPINRKDDESRRLSGSDSDRAWSIVEELQCKTAYVYAMGQEPWLRFVAGLEYTKDSKQIIESDRFVTRCRAEGIHSERLHGSRTFEY
ncbi:hypothetical protein [Xanthomonas sp. NCPPB 2632]|uniref:hypothetical protein n=1 Tax=Xanthomonas sp. NCPPB 2632 TaxID=3240912 RepID=UPI003512A792